MTMKTQPVYRIRYGAVKAAVWANNSLSGYFFHTTFRRAYKNQDDTWGETDSFDDRDLPALAKAALDVHTWIHSAKDRAAKRHENDDEEPDPGDPEAA